MGVTDLAVCWNDCFRRIFRYNRYQSVKDVQYFCNELPLELLYDLLRWKFLRYVSHVPVALRTLFNFQRHVLCEMSKQYGHALSGYGMKQFSRNLHCLEGRTTFISIMHCEICMFYLLLLFTLYFFLSIC